MFIYPIWRAFTQNISGWAMDLKLVFRHSIVYMCVVLGIEPGILLTLGTSGLSSDHLSLCYNPKYFTKLPGLITNLQSSCPRLPSSRYYKYAPSLHWYFNEDTWAMEFWICGRIFSFGDFIVLVLGLSYDWLCFIMEYICTYRHICLYIFYICLNMYTCVYVCLYMFIHVHICVQVYIFSLICMVYPLSLALIILVVVFFPFWNARLSKPSNGNRNNACELSTYATHDSLTLNFVLWITFLEKYPFSGSRKVFHLP